MMEGYIVLDLTLVVTGRLSNEKFKDRLVVIMDNILADDVN